MKIFQSMKQFLPFIVTLLRICLTPIIVYYFLVGLKESIFIGTLFFTIALLSDWLDGFLARRWSVTTELGAFLDSLADKALLWSTMAVLMFYTILSPILFFTVLIRDLLVTALRLYATSKGYPVKTSWEGKVKTCMQYLLCYVGFIQLLALKSSLYSALSMTLPLLWISGIVVFLTILSGLRYFDLLFQRNSPLLQKTTLFIGACAGVGYLPYMPGTWGSLAALLLCFIVPTASLFWLAAGLTALGVWASDHICESAGVKDPSYVVIDEVVGMFLAYSICSPLIRYLEIGDFSPYSLALMTFGLFRFFDILKPWPIYWVESLPGGYGIMMDDVIAGIFSGFALPVLLVFYQ
ncbi:CDP-diacylglycerol--glycerol-3-phosphate 3-phosphatidyltransferase [Candidatus Babeliales bacterium]|nr:CDP-diacylglycerol--glycerol-3-phosphate 3-phosphatidyltransferase [Candidatus Babeliales bacterium]